MVATDVEVRHVHRIADAAYWPWLKKNEGGAVFKHPFCSDCGMVMSIGSDRPFDHGGLTNLVARIAEAMDRDGRRVVEAQKRLIHKRLVARDAGDPFAWSLASQIHLVCDIVGETTGTSHGNVLSYIHKVIGSGPRMKRV